MMCNISLVCNLLIFFSFLWLLMQLPGDLFQFEYSEFEGELISLVSAYPSHSVCGTHSIRRLKPLTRQSNTLELVIFWNIMFKMFRLCCQI